MTEQKEDFVLTALANVHRVLKETENSMAILRCEYGRQAETIFNMAHQAAKTDARMDRVMTVLHEMGALLKTLDHEWKRGRDA